MMSFSHDLKTLNAESWPLLQKTQKDFGLSKEKLQNFVWKGKILWTSL